MRIYTLAAVAPHADADSRSRLAKLLGDSAKADEAMKSAASDLQAMRTFTVSKSATNPAKPISTFSWCPQKNPQQ